MYIKDLDAWAGGFNSRAAPQLFECHVDLEGVNHRHATRGVEFVAAKATQMANEGEKGECSERACRWAVAHGRVGSKAGQQTGGT